LYLHDQPTFRDKADEEELLAHIEKLAPQS